MKNRQNKGKTPKEEGEIYFVKYFLKKISKKGQGL